MPVTILPHDPDADYGLVMHSPLYSLCIDKHGQAHLFHFPTPNYKPEYQARHDELMAEWHALSADGARYVEIDYRWPRQTFPFGHTLVDASDYSKD